MENNKHKILVLSDLNKTTESTLKSSVSLAKITDLDIDFLYVKEPKDIVKNDSQLSAMRTINKDYLTTNKKIKDLIKPISESYNIKIKYTFTIGNLKNEISNYIDNNTKANSQFTNRIINVTRKPLKYFKIIEKTKYKKDNNNKTEEYTFLERDNVIKDISNYLTKSKIDLLFINRQKENLTNINIKDVINTLDCSLLLTN